MKKKALSILLAALTAMTAIASTYHKVTTFPIDGADVQDTFLLVCVCANNAYIFDGQNVTGHNYSLIQNYSGTEITGDYADNEVVFVHNQYYSYNKLFSVLAKGEGDRASGYYMSGETGGKGISFSAGQTNVEVAFDAVLGLTMTAKTGSGVFRFNTADKGFKFYSSTSNMLLPVLYVKGENSRYTGEETWNDYSDQFGYAQAEYYNDLLNPNTTGIYDWDFVMTAEDKDGSLPEIYLKLTNKSNKGIAGSYSSDNPATGAWNLYVTNSSAKSSIYSFESDLGNKTSLYFKWADAVFVAKGIKDGRQVYQIDIRWIDQNGKRCKVSKLLPVVGVLITHTSDSEDDTVEEMVLKETDSDYYYDLPTDAITCDQALDIMDNEEIKPGKTYDQEVTVYGYVTEIVYAYSAEYEDESFWISDTKGGENKIYSYRGKVEKEIKVGNKVAITGYLKNYEDQQTEIDEGKVILLKDGATSVETVVETLEGVYAVGGTICGALDMRIYDLLGADVTEANGALAAGVYLVRAGEGTAKVMVR